MRRLAVLAAAVAAMAYSGAAHAAAPAADARALYVVNAANGEVLAARNAQARLPIASITKLMTVLVALDRLKPDEVVSVSRQAARVGESRIPLRPGQLVTVRDLLAGALIQSANDAADALAAAASGGDIPLFVEWMNERARKLGLQDTHFVRPDGLDAAGEFSSARDVAVLARVAMHSSLVRSLVRRRTATIEGGRLVLHTWNDLLGVFPGLTGVKTGHTAKAGWCEVAAARRRGYTIYAVILGSPSRAQRNADLDRVLAWGVSRYRTLMLVARRAYASAALPYGRPAVQLVAPSPLVRVVRVGRPVVERVIAPTVLALPVTQGRQVGRVEVWAGGTLLGSRPLLTARSVARPGVGGRVRWYATRAAKDFVGLFP